MLELKEIYELDSRKLIGFYIEGHIDKLEFLQLLKNYLEDYFCSDDLEDMRIPELEDIDHIWYKEVTDEEDLDFNNYYSNDYFLYSSKERKGYSLMTKYEL